MTKVQGVHVKPSILGCSTMEDLLKWYNTFTTNPEAVGLSKEALKNLTTPIQPLGIPGVNASFAQGIVATGNKNVTNKVRSRAATKSCCECWPRVGHELGVSASKSLHGGSSTVCIPRAVRVVHLRVLPQNVLTVSKTWTCQLCP